MTTTDHTTKLIGYKYKWLQVDWHKWPQLTTLQIDYKLIDYKWGKLITSWLQIDWLQMNKIDHSWLGINPQRSKWG
jgi:hypothetical protein